MQASLRTLTTIALFAMAVGLASCSKDQSTAVAPTDPFTQEEADDVIVQIAETIALDNSGWLKEITATVEGTDGLEAPTSNPEGVASGVGRPPWATLRDTSFTENGMIYTFNYNYVDTLGQDHFNWVPGVFFVEGLVNATGNVTSPEFNGAYDHNGDFQADFRDFPGFVVFDGFSEDTTLAMVWSAFRTDSSYWFMDIFYDYEDVRMNRNFAANPYPISGIVNLDIDGFALNSMNITDTKNHIEAVVTISFNGTASARVTIIDDFDPPTGVYMYDIDLQTGAITRITSTP